MLTTATAGGVFVSDDDGGDDDGDDLGILDRSNSGGSIGLMFQPTQSAMTSIHCVCCGWIC